MADMYGPVDWGALDPEYDAIVKKKNKLYFEEPNEKKRAKHEAEIASTGTPEGDMDKAVDIIMRAKRRTTRDSITDADRNWMTSRGERYSTILDSALKTGDQAKRDYEAAAGYYNNFGTLLNNGFTIEDLRKPGTRISQLAEGRNDDEFEQMVYETARNLEAAEERRQYEDNKGFWQKVGDRANEFFDLVKDPGGGFRAALSMPFRLFGINEIAEELSKDPTSSIGLEGKAKELGDEVVSRASIGKQLIGAGMPGRRKRKCHLVTRSRKH